MHVGKHRAFPTICVCVCGYLKLYHCSDCALNFSCHCMVSGFPPHVYAQPLAGLTCNILFIWQISFRRHVSLRGKLKCAENLRACIYVCLKSGSNSKSSATEARLFHPACSKHEISVAPILPRGKYCVMSPQIDLTLSLVHLKPVDVYTSSLY